MALEVMRNRTSVVSRISASGTLRTAIWRVSSRITAFIRAPDVKQEVVSSVCRRTAHARLEHQPDDLRARCDGTTLGQRNIGPPGSQLQRYTRSTRTARA